MDLVKIASAAQCFSTLLCSLRSCWASSTLVRRSSFFLLAMFTWRSRPSYKHRTSFHLKHR